LSNALGSATHWLKNALVLKHTLPAMH